MNLDNFFLCENDKKKINNWLKTFYKPLNITEIKILSKVKISEKFFSGTSLKIIITSFHPRLY